jgi:hypothetical protein
MLIGLFAIHVGLKSNIRLLTTRTKIFLLSIQFAPASGGQFTPACTGQIKPAQGGQFHRRLHYIGISLFGRTEVWTRNSL